MFRGYFQMRTASILRHLTMAILISTRTSVMSQFDPWLVHHDTYWFQTYYVHKLVD